MATAFTQPIAPLPGRTSFASRAATSPRRPNVVRCTAATSYAADIKRGLLDRLNTLDFGRTIIRDEEAQKEVDAEVRQLEALNPSKEPVADPNINTKWRMVYTTSTGILGTTRPSFFRPCEMLQTIDTPNLYVKNTELIKLGPLPITNAVEAKIIKTTDKRVTVQFQKFTFLGFIPVNVANDRSFVGWQDITYLDEDLRISRGNEGNLFVLVKAEEE